MTRLEVRPEAAPEPTAGLPLAFGDHRGRTWTGGALILAGAALIMPTTAYTVPLGLFGCLLHVLGWAVLPGRPGRRAAVAVPSMLACWCTMLGPRAMWVLAVVLVLWLFVRGRPLSGYLAALLPLAAGAVVGVFYTSPLDKAPAFAVVGVAAAAGAWLARESALRSVPRPLLQGLLPGRPALPAPLRALVRPRLGRSASAPLMNRIGTVDPECGDTP